MDEENAITLGSLIGEVLMVENPRRNGLLIRGFLRARVMVDLRKPLVTGMWVPRPGRDPVWVKARYERLQNFCYRCGRIGHDRRCCSDKDEEDSDEELQFGGWLGIQAARPCDCEIICCKSGWEEYVEVCEKTKASEEGREEKAKKEEAPKVMQMRVGDLRMDAGKKEERRAAIRSNPRRMSNSDPCKEKGDKGSDVPETLHPDFQDRERKDLLQKDDFSKAIVLYGSYSPVSEVMNSLRKIKLKRSVGVAIDRDSVKKRRLEFLGEEKNYGTEVEKTQEGGGRRSVRVLKGQLRRGNRRKGGSYGSGSVDNVKDKVVLSCTDADGIGGWLESATKEQ